MTTPIIVRLAEEGEEPLVFALMRAGFAESAGYANPSSALTETLTLLREKTTTGGAVLAFEGGRPAGSARFRVDQDAGYLSFERLVVHPAVRSRGIGSAMVTHLESHARALGLNEIRADARSQQPDNRPFYLARGYRVVGYSDRYGITKMRTHMAKALGGAP